LNKKTIKSGDEIVNEFFKQVMKDKTLDQETTKALLELYTDGKFKRPQIKKKLDAIRESILEEEDDQIKKDQG